MRQIVVNAGKDSSVVVAAVLKRGAPYGFNALSEEVEDLLVAGVIDPVKLVKDALRNASSAAGTTLLSEALVADAKEDDE